MPLFPHIQAAQRVSSVNTDLETTPSCERFGMVTTPFNVVLAHDTRLGGIYSDRVYPP